MQRNDLFNSVGKKFYDPLYEIVVFSAPEEDLKARNMWYESPSDSQAVTHEQFVSILDSYEFSRMNFLHQSGLAWLVFPSATHTRFAHALGSWLLSEWAVNDVFINLKKRSVDKTTKKQSGLRTLTRLKANLKTMGWLEEFQLALLLHDIGHFPFSHVIENNTRLIENYFQQEETKGIVLNHEAIGVQLILGDNPISELFNKFIHNQLGDDADSSAFLSHCLKDIPYVDPKKIAYLLAPDVIKLDDKLSKKNTRLIPALHELVSGVIDLDRLDHYHRDSVSTSMRAGEFNVRGLLNNLAIIDIEKNDNMQIQLVGDGIDHAFQMLYARTSLTRSVFHNKQNLAHEVMLNYAINCHWESAEEDFRLFFPFYDDLKLLGALEQSTDRRAAGTVQRIKARKSFICVGKYYLSDKSYDKLGRLNKKECRSAFIATFNEKKKSLNLNDDQVFIRLDGQFGDSGEGSDWLDLSKIVNENRKPLSEMPDHVKFMEFIRERHCLSVRTFWLFVSHDSNEFITAADTLAKNMGGEAF